VGRAIVPGGSQVVTPPAVLDDMINDQVVARRGQRRQAPVKPGENRGRIRCHANGPWSSRRAGSMPLATRWLDDTYRNGSGSLSCIALAKDDLPELEAPFSAMMRPGPRSPGTDSIPQNDKTPCNRPAR
jgi:hypothetical protein